jgi:hypothetical protein
VSPQGDAYVYLAPGRTEIQNPAVVVEGFDLDNSMNWDELYALLNQENLIETLRADGYDAVVLNFADATDYLQRNAFTVVDLLQQIQAIVGPQTTVALAGASMGGLVSRYALAYMETNALPHSVRTFVSFDAPHLGANIPLGIQYWVNFFSDQSSDAAFFLSLLNRPAARQMLVYHYTDPAGSTGQPDPLRGAFATGSHRGGQLAEPATPGGDRQRKRQRDRRAVRRGRAGRPVELQRPLRGHHRQHLGGPERDQHEDLRRAHPDSVLDHDAGRDRERHAAL